MDEPILDRNQDEELEEGAPSKHIADRLLDSRIILLTEPVSAELAQDVVGRLLLLDAEGSDEPVTIYINSPGGSVDAGFAIFDMMRFISAPIRCVANGLCASAAVIILLAADKGRRLSLPNSRFLLHQPSGGARGTTADVQIEAAEILKIQKRITDLLAKETGQPADKVDSDSRRNYWMSADEALEYGLLSSIVTSKDDLK